MLQEESKKEKSSKWIEKLKKGLTEEEANQLLFEVKEATEDKEIKEIIEKLLKEQEEKT